MYSLYHALFHKLPHYYILQKAGCFISEQTIIINISGSLWAEKQAGITEKLCFHSQVAAHFFPAQSTQVMRKKTFIHSHQTLTHTFIRKKKDNTLSSYIKSQTQREQRTWTAAVRDTEDDTSCTLKVFITENWLVSFSDDSSNTSENIERENINPLTVSGSVGVWPSEEGATKHTHTDTHTTPIFTFPPQALRRSIRGNLNGLISACQGDVMFKHGCTRPVMSQSLDEVRLMQDGRIYSGGNKEHQSPVTGFFKRNSGVQNK